MGLQKDFMNKLALWIGTVFGLGYAHFMPGTFGSFPGVFLYVLYPHPALIFVLFMIGWIASFQILKSTKDRDPSFIVIDETVGMMLTMALTMPQTWIQILLAFTLFRILDILKPWPISLADQFFKDKNNILAAFGIMFDDLLAALFAAGIYLIYLF